MINRSYTKQLLCLAACWLQLPLPCAASIIGTGSERNAASTAQGGVLKHLLVGALLATGVHLLIQTLRLLACGEQLKGIL